MSSFELLIVSVIIVEQSNQSIGKCAAVASSLCVIEKTLLQYLFEANWIDIFLWFIRSQNVPIKSYLLKWFDN